MKMPQRPPRREWRRVVRAWEDGHGHYWEESGPWEETSVDLPDWWPTVDRWVHLATHVFLIVVLAWFMAILLADAWCGS